MAAATRDHGFEPNTLHKAKLAGRLDEVGNLGSLLPPKPKRACMTCGGKITDGTHMCNKCRRKSSGLA